MIENLRKYTGLIIVVVALLFVGLVFFEGSAGSGPGRSGEPPVIAVDGRQYSASEVQKLGASPVALVQAFGMYGMIDFLAMLGGFGGGDEAVNRFFVNRLNLRQAANEFGVHPSDEEIAAEIKTMPSFQGADGAYDQQAYNDFVNKRIGRLGLNEREFLDIVRDTLAARKLAEIIGGGLSADRGVAAQQVISNDQQVTIQLSRLALSKFQEELKPTDEELKTEWETTKDKYLTDRKIKVSYVIAKPTYPELPKEEAKLPDAVTEEQKKEEEKKAAEKKAADEAKLAEQKRKIDGELADAVDSFLLEIEANEGKEFEQLAKDNGWEVVTTELFPRTALPAALAINTRSTSKPRPIGDLLFQLTKSADAMTQFSDALPIADGAFLVARLDEAEEARPKTFEEAKDAVRTDYIATKAGEALKKDADEKAAKLREAIAAGKSFADAAKELGLEVKSHGPFKSTDKLDGEADTSLLFQTASLVDPGALADPVMRPDGALFVFVDKREIVKDPARDERINQSLSGLTSNQQRLAFSAWLEEKLESTKVDDLLKKP